MKQIASPDNPTFRQALRLHQSARERRKLGRTLLDGVHLVQEYLATDHRPEQLLVTASGLANAEIAALVQSVGEMHSALLADDLFAQVTSLDSPSGVVAVIDTPEEGPLPLDAPACLMLDDVQDPGNVGAIVRVGPRGSTSGERWTVDLGGHLRAPSTRCSDSNTER